MEVKPNLQDFSTIETILKQKMTDLNLKSKSSAFYFFALDLLLNLQEDEIKECITDTNYLTETATGSGHDRGIDALYIEQTETKNRIHLFNFKYTDKFDKTKNNFPAGEIEKILVFLDSLLCKDTEYANTANIVLANKMKEIWAILNTENPEFVVHICSNHYLPFEKNEKDRFERCINQRNHFEVKYHLMSDFVQLLTKKGKIIVNAKLRGIDKQYFARIDGDVKALIVNIDVVELLRICLNDETIRMQVDQTDSSALKQYTILDDIFEDNVRIYLKQRSKINRNIKNTALSEDGYRLFYYNNGITIVCNHFEYTPTRSPIIDIQDLQVVNGGQTIHALFDAFLENDSNFDNMTVLCRIYETKNKQLSTHIAEYTNSQNPVNTRDIRSVDYIQIKLEKELQALGYYYERKKNQFVGKSIEKRLDSEKVGQVLMALYNKMPAEAKDKKRLIFAEKYDEIFNENINADKVLTAYLLFKSIEDKKAEIRNRIYSDNEIDKVLYETESPALYGSYWILYLMGRIATIYSIPLKRENVSKIQQCYSIAEKMIRDAWQSEKASALTVEQYFKKNKPTKYIDAIFEKKDKTYFDELDAAIGDIL